MTNQTNKRKSFIIQQRSKIVDELMKKPFAFLLLTQIARRAKRTTDFTVNNLEIGECFVGDYKSIGATEQQYRTAKANIQKWGFATFKATNRGTIAKLTDTRVYDINEYLYNEPDNRQTTNKQRTNNEPDNRQTTTNKNIRNKEVKNEKNYIYVELSESLKEIIEYKQKRKIAAKNWQEDIRKLIEIDLQERQDALQDVKTAIQAIEDYSGEQYFPIVQSASALREKFSKIENYLARQKNSRTDLSASEIMDLDLTKEF